MRSTSCRPMRRRRRREPNIAKVNAPSLWSLGYYGQGVVVANLDSGVDATHPDLAPVVPWRIELMVRSVRPARNPDGSDWSRDGDDGCDGRRPDGRHEHWHGAGGDMDRRTGVQRRRHGDGHCDPQRPAMGVGPRPTTRRRRMRRSSSTTRGPTAVRAATSSSSQTCRRCGQPESCRSLPLGTRVPVGRQASAQPTIPRRCRLVPPTSTTHRSTGSARAARRHAVNRRRPIPTWSPPASTSTRRSASGCIRRGRAPRSRPLMLLERSPCS